MKLHWKIKKFIHTISFGLFYDIFDQKPRNCVAIVDIDHLMNEHDKIRMQQLLAQKNAIIPPFFKNGHVSDKQSEIVQKIYDEKI